MVRRNSRNLQQVSTVFTLRGGAVIWVIVRRAMGHDNIRCKISYCADEFFSQFN